MIKCKIRNNVFETNSSSMHSIVVSKKTIKDEHKNWKHFLYELSYLDSMNHSYLTGDGKRILNLCLAEESQYNGYYGRSPFGILSDFDEKLCYAIASLCNNQKDFKKIFVPIIKTVIEKGLAAIKEEEENIPDRLKYDIVKIVDGYNSKIDYVFGYVDHQSQDLLKNFLDEEKVSLLDFLTDSRYIVIIDGDEYCITDTIFESFGTDNIKKVYK